VPDSTHTHRDESRALTGLRGAAAMLVMLHHFYLKLALHEHLPFLQHLLRRGYLGVDLFFVLSGFVLSMVYGSWFARPDRATPEDYLRFLVRRVARLWPLYAAVLVVLIGLEVGDAAAGVSPRLLAGNLLMVQAWGWSREINPPAWSISTEFMVYLAFPLLAWVGLARRWGMALCLLGAALALAACLRFAPPLGPGRRGLLDLYMNYSLLPPLRCLAGFLIGMATWRAIQSDAVRRVASLPWLAPAAIAGAVAFLLGRVNDLAVLALMPAIVAGLHVGDGPVQRAFGTGALHGLGVLSYAVYLVHVTMLEAFPFRLGPLPVMLLAYCAAVLAVAWAAHRLVEVPGRTALRRAGDAALRRLFRPRAAA
jgi:peptidoglycan/LPS O-acetylase OafA/YrhL